MHNFHFPPAPSSSPWYPTWHPGGDRVAVAMSGSLWEVDIASGDAFEIVHGPDYYSSPNYSPDGTWLVFTADDGGGTIDLEVMNTATGRRQRLTEGEHIHTDPRFSPSGNRIAYVSTAPSGYFNVYIRPFADGAWGGDEIAVTSDHSFGRDRLYFGPWDMHISPDWLPSGEELLLVSNRDVALGSGNVYRVPARAGGIEERQAVLAEQTLYRTQPHVSYDGKRFVYSSTAGSADQFQNLYVQPTTGGEPYKMTFFDYDAFHPRWSPDAEWIAFVANDGGLPQLHLLEANGGALRRIDIAERHWARPTGTLSLTTVDADDNPVASRIHLTASDGKVYAPADAYARVSRAGDRIFHHPGSFSVELPVGTAQITIVRGFETQPFTFEPLIEEGKVNTTTVRLTEISDVSDEGWLSGSTHVHMNYAGNLRNSLPNLMMMSAAEDQDIVNEQIANKDNRILDHQFWVPGGGIASALRAGPGAGRRAGVPPALLWPRLHVRSPRPPDRALRDGLRGHRDREPLPQQHRHAAQGEGAGSHDGVRALVLQRRSAGGDSGRREGVHRRCRAGRGRCGGVVGAAGWLAAALCGLEQWNQGRAGRWRGLDLEPARHATRGFDAHLRADAGWPAHHGRLVPGAAGRARVYEFGTASGLQRRRGGAGEDLVLDEPGEVQLSGRVWGMVPMEKAEVVVNGEVVRTYLFEGDRKSLVIDDSIPMPGSGWVHLRVTGLREDRWPLDTSYPQAATNPVWVTVGGEPIRSPEAADYAIAWIDKLEVMADEWPGWRSEREREHVFAQFEQAREVYRRRGAEAVGAATLEAPRPGEPPRGRIPMHQPTVTEQSSGTTETLQAISPVSEETVWVSGHGGVILRTLDGGAAWERTSAPGGDSLQFRDIHGFSAESAVALTAGEGPMSRLYRTDDGGNSWTLGFLMEEPAGFLDCLDFWDENHGFAYGDSFDGVPYILVTRDGGHDWTRVSAETSPPANEGEGGFAASGTCARAAPGGRGWIGTGAGGSARILATGDYGRTWTATETPVVKGALAGIFTLVVADGRPIMALGGDLDRREEVVAGNAAVTGDAGRTWTLVSPAPINGAVYGSAAGGTGANRWVVAVAPPGGVYTGDMGKSWKALPEVSAWAVEFAPGGRVGWAAGGGGRIWRIEW